MRSIFLLLATLLGTLLSGLVANAANTPVACTMEYAPVCGSVQVQCIQAPCNPVRETFGNACMAGAAGATIHNRPLDIFTYLEFEIRK